jgi:CHAD domain-containing protein
MKARKIRSLDPDGSLIDGARRILTVRLDEVASFAPAATDSHDERALHDMRIAFKRLRYVLEVMRPCFGEPAAEAIASAKRFQDLLGEIHDCDVMLPMVEAHGGLEAVAAHFRSRREVLHRRLMRDLDGKRWAGLRDGVAPMAQAGS